MSTTIDDLDNYLDPHYIQRSNWLRAAVLGANDGIISTASLAIGVASANADQDALLLATLAGVVAGALSMAAGEFVSVSSQSDIEKADIERERLELEETPQLELDRLAHIYQQRGLKPETAKLVAQELTEKDALAAHVRDELGISDISQANPVQAAISSGLAFLVGGFLPLMVVLLFPMDYISYYLYLFSIGFLVILGVISAITGGSSIKRGILRITFWGTFAMVISALIGYLFEINV